MGMLSGGGSTSPIQLNGTILMFTGQATSMGAVLYVDRCAAAAAKHSEEHSRGPHVEGHFPPRHPYTLMAQLLCAQGEPSVSGLCCCCKTQ
jgi:hypothetical protein